MKFTSNIADADEKLVRLRLRLAQAFIDLLLYAYDAMLYHGVNYRNLAAYKDETLLSEAERLPMEEGHDRFITWLGRVRSSIRAEIRRKDFRKV